LITATFNRNREFGFNEVWYTWPLTIYTYIIIVYILSILTIG
jgi:hypothetical protein